MHSPQPDSDFRARAPVGQQSAPAQQLHQLHAYTTDGPIVETTIKTRSPREQALAIGAEILERLDGLAVWPTLDCPLACQVLVHRMVFKAGQVEPWSAGLVVRHGAKEIAELAGLTPRSAYKPMRALEGAGIIRRIRPGGNRADAYEVPMPAPPDDERDDQRERAPRVPRHPTVPLAAQSARATARAAPVGATLESFNPITDNELARATARAAPVGATLPGPNAGFSTGNALAAPVARAGDSTVRTSTSTYTSTREAEGRGDGGNPKAEERGPSDDGWFLAWMLSLKGRGGEPMKPWVARKWARHAQITPKIQHAARYELEHSTASTKPNFNAAGLLHTILGSPMTQIGDEAWAYADQQLAEEGPRRERQFTGTRVAELFAEPAASPFAVGAAADAGQSIEARAREIQQTLSRAELDAIHREAINAVPPGLQRMCVAKGDPRKLDQVHALIVQRLATGSGAAR